MRTFIAAAFVLASLSLATPARAQLLAAKDGPVAYGHHHINASDVAAHKKFWVDGLGGKPVTLGSSPAVVIEFPNVLVFLTARAATGGTKGTVVNHVGFEVPDIRAAVDRLIANGSMMVTQAEGPANIKIDNHVASSAAGVKIAYVMGPDDTKVELIENTAVKHPIVMHHIHWAAPDVAAMKAWYVQMLGAKPGRRGNFEAGDLPGVNLTFGSAAAGEAPVSTKGRALDHIGFEVRNLEQFVKDLEAKGVKFDRPYTKVAALNIAIAFFTDPWGTYVELTEGLNAVP
jgi:catechol 2,3-dioxygenase-like lactoylglutathione lyase family enzyme